MRFSGRQGVGAACVALAVLAAGCRGCKPESAQAPVQAPEAPAPEEAPAPRRGVKVPMPPSGWTARVAADGSFQFGPPGHPVLRVDLRPGQGDTLPSADELTASVKQSFQGFERSGGQTESSEDLTLLRVTLAPHLADGGVGGQYPALFGAKRVGGDLFLCATLPGVSAEDVKLAAEACRGIEFQTPR